MYLHSLAIAAATFIFALSAPLACAADIRLVPNGNNVPFIVITGEIVSGDAERFNRIAQSIPAQQAAVIGLVSSGGVVGDAITIGETIRFRGWITVVADTVARAESGGHGICMSACADIWISGAQRYASPESFIGFHSAYSATTHQELGSANALVGSYLTRMGLSYGAIVWMTTAGPDQMMWLSAEDAEKHGITFVGKLPSQADLAAIPATAPTTVTVSRPKISGKPYVDSHGNYVMPPSFVSYVFVKPETVAADPPNYQLGLAILRKMFGPPLGPVWTLADGSVVISAQSVVNKNPRCRDSCAYEAMDIMTSTVLSRAQQSGAGSTYQQVRQQ